MFQVEVRVFINNRIFLNTRLGFVCRFFLFSQKNIYFLFSNRLC